MEEDLSMGRGEGISKGHLELGEIEKAVWQKPRKKTLWEGSVVTSVKCQWTPKIDEKPESGHWCSLTFNAYKEFGWVVIL